jgi:predicted O-methyltransferase YrrM
MIPALARQIRLFSRFLRASADLLEGYGAQRRFKDAPEEIDSAYSFLAEFAYGDVRPIPFQIREEFIELLDRVHALAPQKVLEIGTALGGTLFLFTRAAPPEATIVTVDMPGGPFGGGYPRGHSPLLRSFARDSQKIHLVRGDSHSPSTLQKVTRLLGGPADFLFIDGDHTYDGVRADFEMYSPLVREGGLIALHDIVEGSRENVGDVPRFWKELHAGVVRQEEIVSDYGQNGWGIGLIRKHS